MERSSQYEDVAAALAPLRPSPRPAFAAELDERVAAGFPQSRGGRSPLAALAARVRSLSPQRMLFISGGAALATIAIATLVVASVDSGSRRTMVERQATKRPPHSSFFTEKVPVAPGVPSASSAAGAHGSGEIQLSTDGSGSYTNADKNASAGLVPSSQDLVPFSRATHREIERSAEIGLLAEPADVADDSAQVFSAVHSANGIVLHSTTTQGRHASADFDLLIPSRNLGDALAAFSAIDEVRSRHEATDDITAPTVSLEEGLQDSQARIDGLLAQLSVAETESEREAVEIELRGERRHAAGLRSQLDRLHQRTDFSRVSLRIETGASSPQSGGGWGVDDALDDAGHILGIAAGVTLVGLAVIAPLALICLLTWLAYGIWLRARREQAISKRV